MTFDSNTPFFGTAVNIMTVLGGSTIGLLAGSRLPERIKEIILQCLGIGTLFIGFSMALKAHNQLLVIGALLLGGILGELIRIDAGLDAMAERLKRQVGSDSPKFVTGFVSATLLFCIGPLTFVGSIQDGMGDSKLILMKATLDAFSSLALASALGIGVVFSALSVLVVQGGLALAGRYLGAMAPPALIDEVSAVGGLMVIGIGINLLGLKEIRVANFLPALLLVPLLMKIVSMLN